MTASFLIKELFDYLLSAQNKKQHSIEDYVIRETTDYRNNPLYLETEIVVNLLQIIITLEHKDKHLQAVLKTYIKRCIFARYLFLYGSHKEQIF